MRSMHGVIHTVVTVVIFQICHIVYISKDTNILCMRIDTIHGDPSRDDVILQNVYMEHVTISR